MSVELKIVSEHADLVGDDFTREFGDDGGTIGRSLQNDWILPDPDRYISGRHATIDFQGGTYYIADTSSNGVYVNDEVEPIGKGNPRRLFNGDRLRMGDFRIAVSIDSGEELALPDEPLPSVAPDHIEEFVDEVSIRTGMQLLDEDEIADEDVFQSALFSSAPKPIVTAPVEKKPISNKPVANDDKKTPQKSKAPTVNSGADAMFDSFLEGLGINNTEFHPSVSRTEMMRAAGVLLRESTSGLTKLLQNRVNLKDTFRLDQTILLPRHNNPMKHSTNTDDLLKQLLVGTEGDYLGAEDSVREVCRDLSNHHNAFLDAMSSAFIEFAERFDPDELEESFDKSMNGSKLFGFLNQFKYWQMYVDQYPIITEKGGGRFPQMFAEEFVNAYERQVAEYQRHDRHGVGFEDIGEVVDLSEDSDLIRTQKLKRPVAAEVDPQPAEAEIDQRFIDELENSMNESMDQDQLKA